MFSETFEKTANILKATGLPYVFKSKGKAKLRERALTKMLGKAKNAPKKKKDHYQRMANRAAKKYKDNPRAIDITRGRTTGTLVGLGAGGGALAKKTYEEHVPGTLREKLEKRVGLR
jgi:hypothetical protein